MFENVARNGFEKLEKGRFAALIIGRQVLKRAIYPAELRLHGKNEPGRLHNKGDYCKRYSGQRKSQRETGESLALQSALRRFLHFQTRICDGFPEAIDFLIYFHAELVSASQNSEFFIQIDKNRAEISSQEQKND